MALTRMIKAFWWVLVAPRRYKYVGLGLMLIRYIETSAVYMSKILNEAYRGWYKYVGDDASNEAVGVEAEIEADIRGWGM